jgi:hypothetical protein
MSETAFFCQYLPEFTEEMGAFSFVRSCPSPSDQVKMPLAGRAPTAVATFAFAV